MPSVSGKQHRLMEAAAHTPGGAGGVPQSVGRDFVAADKGKKFPSARQSRANRYKRPKKASIDGQQVAGTGTGIEAS